ncbi:mitochondrial transcription termination factor-like family-3 [Chlorella sorokiniana]|uniref:Mitochondrial transcription termination factor-like family-3 n=1 Tax=Chlorella sorokiniana TaxID=3076 RepID=A0A2P6TP37_CHLSO|nr:mitochondrial transcription termination factor-like family-3 [Chlorella sorokiniana]|eukprot:PRW51094.1 mitochondrial transcription termination factor-like family-3 [Chlorella sorokiniana]
MLAAGLLTHALRAARQRAPARGLVAAATAAWRLLQSADPGASCSGSSSGSGSSHWLRASGTRSSVSFSSSALASSTAQDNSHDEEGSGSGSKSKHARPRGAGGVFISHTAEPQPQLQAWLQQEQGLPAEAAGLHARRLALVFGSQQAALDGLPATFEWCRSRGLTGLQTAQLLDDIAKCQRDSVVQFAALVQPVWQLMDSYVAAWAEQQQQAGDSKQRKHTSLAEALCSKKTAEALGVSPGHVEAWLAARNLDSLLQALGWPAEQARQLVLKQPVILAPSPDTVQASLAWLRQLFPDAEQLAGVIGRGSRLLGCSVQHLQGNANYLRHALGWQDGNSQLAAFVAARPADFATINLSGEGTPHKLRLLSEVVGVSTQECLTSGIGYLNKRLDNISARYMLVQERAPYLLLNRSGKTSLSWIKDANKPHSLRRLGMSRHEFNAFVRAWPASPEGRRLLAGLRAGSVEGWPRPPTWEEAQRRRAVAAAGAGVKRPRRRRSKA